jgi:hypothetical protein
MAVGIVAAAAEQRVRRPGAAATAGLGVVATAAKTPEILDAAVAVELQRGVGRPKLRDRRVAYVTCAIALGSERRTTFKRSVGFQPDRVLARGTAAMLLPGSSSRSRSRPLRCRSASSGINVVSS